MPTRRMVVLGGGRVGGFIARRLASHRRIEVLLVDQDASAFVRAADDGARIATRAADLSDPAAIAAAVEGADLAIGALPGRMGFSALSAMIEAGRNVVDISFFPEDPFALHEAARARGVTAVVDCGVMPGLGGMLAMHLTAKLDPAEEVRILVGGLPVLRRRPTEYKAPFSPADVIEEYTRPARFRENGRVVSRPALSEPEMLELPGVGSVEAFLTDGLRTLLDTLQVPTMREKTLRWPGHRERMELLRDLGFFGEVPVTLPDGGSVRPVDVASALLFKEWELEPGEPELTVMRVEAIGRREGRPVVLRADLLDRTDPDTGDSSMARTTGGPAMVAAGLLLDGKLPGPGILPAEKIGADPALFAAFRDQLAHAGIQITESAEELPTWREGT